MAALPDFDSLYITAGEAFTPSAPIDQRSLFAGRLDQISALMDTVRTKGQHGVVYGERGVGKTSLVSILGPLLSLARSDTPAVPTIRVNCNSTETFSTLWRRAFELAIMEAVKPSIGFGAQDISEFHNLADEVSKTLTPGVVVGVLRGIERPIVFIFDEFDQLTDQAAIQSFTEVIKALSDFACSTKIVIVGVGDTVDAVIRAHASAERAIRQIHMPRMLQQESSEIISKAMSMLGMSCATDAETRIVVLSQGLPHYVHALGLLATRATLAVRRTHITMALVMSAITEAQKTTQQTILDSYVKAVTSPQKDTLYKYILLACALAKTDELSKFAPADVRETLKKMGRPLGIPAFAGHLNKFSGTDRGNILQKYGSKRRYRYRFSSPLLQPYVVVRGISDGLIAADLADSLLRRDSGAKR